MSGEKNKLDSKSKQLIVGIFAVLILLTFSAVMIIAAYNFSLHDNSESTTSETNGLQNSTMTNVVTTTDTSKNNITTTNSSTESVTDFNNSQSSGQEAVSVEGLEEFTKTGDNQISVSPDNEFIKLIVEKKSVDSERLVAIYAVPDLGNNFVLEFDN